jgi:phospholipase/carboxylesterase
MQNPPEWRHEDGFEFALFPAKNGTARSLVIVLHGHGSNTANWEAHARQMQEEMPDADILTLQGPVKLPKGHAALRDGAEGFTWNAYEGPKLRQVKETLSHIFNRLPVVHRLNRFIDRQLEKRGLTDDDLGLVGSSMGGITALQAALARKKPVAGVVSHSGALLPLSKVKSRPPVLLIMGGQDEVFNAPAVKRKGLKRLFAALTKPLALQHRDTLRRFRQKRIPFTEKLYPALAHEVTPETISEGDRFLAQLLARKRGSKPPAK